MPNTYITLAEIKASAPDSIRKSTDKYDAVLLRLANEVSRWIDARCKRVFYPTLATRYFSGSRRGYSALWVPDLISITSVSISYDYGTTYTALVSGTDYIATAGGDENTLGSYSQLVVHPNSSELSVWPDEFRGVKIVGVWAYADDRTLAWESTGDTVQNNPLSSSGTSLSVSDLDGRDLYGGADRFMASQILRIESEYVETTLAMDATANTIGILRARNGTTGAAHVQGTAIDVWRPPEPVKQAAAIQAFRQMERGFQGFGDARAQPEVGQLFFFKAFDPEAETKLQYYVRDLPA